MKSFINKYHLDNQLPVRRETLKHTVIAYFEKYQMEGGGKIAIRGNESNFM